MKVHLSPWQTKVWNDPHRYKVINIGRRGGKTFFAALKLIHFASSKENQIIWYIAPTYAQAKQILWEMLKDLVPEHGILKKSESPPLYIELKNGSKIFIKGGSDPDSLRGVRIDLAVFDEVAFFDRWDEVWKVIRPTLADSKADVIFISTPNGFNHFKNMAEETNEDWQYFHYTTYDNPHIPVEEIEQMKQEMDEDSFAQEIMGEFRRMSGLIYKTFSRDTHMVEIPDHFDPGSWSFYRSLDFGFAHKTALLYFAVNNIGTQIYCFDGMYQSDVTTQDIGETVKIKDGGRQYTRSVADSAQPVMIEELRRQGIYFEPVDKGPDSVKNGISKVAELLKVRQDTGKPTLMFNKDLNWIADEFEKYRWMENKVQGVMKEVPLKRDDDACFVAGTRILTTNGLVKIEDITSSHVLITPLGFSKTTGSMCTGVKKVIDYGLFVSTPNHKIITNRGIVRVDALRYNDYICQIEKVKEFSLMGFLTDAIQTQETELIDYIFKGLLIRSLEAKLGFYTGINGNITTGKSLRGWKYTTLMVIPQIMIYLIWALLRILNMLSITIGGSGKALRDIKTKLLKKQKNGEGQINRKQSSYIQKLPRKDGVAGRSKVEPLKNARPAEESTTHTSLTEVSTVIKIAKPRLVGEEKVYNLASDHGVYFANGVLVSNCDAVRYFAMSYNQNTQAYDKSKLPQYQPIIDIDLGF